jgi:hypothetical protein
MKKNLRSLPVAKISALAVVLCLITDPGLSAAGKKRRPVSQPTETYSPLQPVNNSPVPQIILAKIKQDIEIKYGASAVNLKLSDSGKYLYKDSCLGLPAPVEKCINKTTKAWRVTLEDGAQVYRYHANTATIRSEAALPFSVAEKILKVASQDSKIPRTQLRVTDISIARFQNSCLDISIVCEQGHDKKITDGWRVFVADHRKLNGKGLIYHADRLADRVAANQIAMNIPENIRVNLKQSSYFKNESDIVFFSLSLGLPNFNSKAYYLRGDGELNVIASRFERSTKANKKKKDSLITESSTRTLSLQEVQDFKDVLQQQNFNSFGSLEYRSAHLILDGGITSFGNQNSDITFFNVFGDDQPPALQAVQKAWSELIESSTPTGKTTREVH